MKKKREKEKIRSFIIRDSSRVRKHTKLFVVFLFVFSLGIMAFYNMGYTGFAVINAGEGMIIMSEERVFDGSFEYFNVAKEENKALEVSIESNIPMDVSVKEGVCEAWADVNEKAASFENTLSKTFIVGNRFGSQAEMDAYSSGNVCVMALVSEDLGVDVSRIQNQESFIKLIVKEK